MTPLLQSKRSVRHSIPKVLVVDDERDLVELVSDTLNGSVECRLTHASTCAQALERMDAEPVDLLIVDLALPDGSGAELIQALREKHPLASTIVITGAPSYERAVSALRSGAADFLAKPFTAAELLDRATKVLKRQEILIKSESRIDRLRDAVRRLNESRRLVTKKVDLLCNDLVSAYGDLSRQFDVVRTSESFRQTIQSANDLEQMLCHSMDWLLRQVGYSNVAIWLAGDGGFQLGAYMKYTITGEVELIQAMQEGLLPLIGREASIHLSGEEVALALSPVEAKYLNGQTILGVHCTYLGESLAQMILFRDQSKPFSDADAATLRSISSVFAVTLATKVRAEDSDADETDGDGDSPLHDGDPMNEDDFHGKNHRRPRKKKDEADWWKRGEDPPF